MDNIFFLSMIDLRYTVVLQNVLFCTMNKYIILCYIRTFIYPQDLEKRAVEPIL
jgi:hypothetical protein